VQTVDGGQSCRVLQQQQQQQQQRYSCVSFRARLLPEHRVDRKVFLAIEMMDGKSFVKRTLFAQDDV
jgi:hypothetical protein